MRRGDDWASGNILQNLSSLPSPRYKTAVNYGLVGATWTHIPAAHRIPACWSAFMS